MSLVLDWKKKLGYSRDPFTTGIVRPVTNLVVGYAQQQEQFNLFLIKNERFGTLTGDEGTGKTTFLTWVKEALNKKVRTHYVDAEKSPDQLSLIDAILTDTTNVFTRRLTLKKAGKEKYASLVKKLQKRPHVLLVDNAGNLTQEGVDLLSDLLGRTPSYLFLADTKDGLKKVSFSKSTLSLKTPSYSQETLIELLTNRIVAAGGSGTFPFTEKQLAKLAKDAGNNPAQFLAKARELAIELSLKVDGPPEPSQRAVVKTPGKKSKFLSIQVQRGPKAKVKDPEPPKLPDDEPHPDEEKLLDLLKGGE